MPVIAGLFALFSFLGALLSRIIMFFFEHAGRKLVVIAGVLVVLTTFITGFYFAIKGLLDGLAIITPPYFAQACSLFVPDNLAALASVQITARLLRFAYEWNVKVLQWKL